MNTAKAFLFVGSIFTVIITLAIGMAEMVWWAKPISLVGWILFCYFIEANRKRLQ